ncbi:unnamed protein product [Symbiodinium microadriaticum]|nr:unnamed protein product [Symbiodinium microadriaticum]
MRHVLGRHIRACGRRAFSTEKPKVMILGTGWASFRVLADIDTKKTDVTVVSPRNHLLFTPMLASSALGTVNQRSICQPVRPLVAKKNATYYESAVVAIDKATKKVTCRTVGGEEYMLPYDKLVVGVGFQPNDFNIPGVKEHALFMKETADATRFKDHVLEKLEEASYHHALDNDLSVSDEERARIQDLLTFVVVGGGPTGVELAGELTDFLYNEGAKLYGHLKHSIRVHMFTYDLLNTFDQDLQDYALTHLQRKQGVQIHLGAFVQKVEPNVVHVKTGESLMSIRYGTLVWCAGIKPHPFVKSFGFTMNDRGSQILVDPYLKVKGEDDIYAIGDCSTIEDYWLPQTAQVANQEGQYLAKVLSQKDPLNIKPFEFHNKGTMAYLGGFTAVMAKLPGVNRVTGFVAFLGWRFTYWLVMGKEGERRLINEGSSGPSSPSSFSREEDPSPSREYLAQPEVDMHASASAFITEPELSSWEDSSYWISMVKQSISSSISERETLITELKQVLQAAVRERGEWQKKVSASLRSRATGMPESQPSEMREASVTVNACLLPAVSTSHARQRDMCQLQARQSKRSVGAEASRSFRSRQSSGALTCRESSKSGSLGWAGSRARPTPVTSRKPRSLHVILEPNLGSLVRRRQRTEVQPLSGGLCSRARRGDTEVYMWGWEPNDACFQDQEFAFSSYTLPDVPRLGHREAIVEAQLLHEVMTALTFLNGKAEAATAAKKAVAWEEKGASIQRSCAVHFVPVVLSPAAMGYEDFMRLALEEARAAMLEGRSVQTLSSVFGEVPVGCILVSQTGDVLARAGNETNRSRNGTRHCEFVASEKVLRQADGPALLRNSTLYVTLEPCIMCAAALQYLGIPEVVFGSANVRFGGCGGVCDIHKMKVPKSGPGGGADAAREALPGFACRGGVLAEEAVEVLREFYATGNPNAPEAKRHRPLPNAST